LLHAPVGINCHWESIGGVPAVEKITPGETGVTGGTSLSQCVYRWRRHLAGCLEGIPALGTACEDARRTAAGTAALRSKLTVTSEEMGIVMLKIVGPFTIAGVSKWSS
jgi:hypothetical protein